MPAAADAVRGSKRHEDRTTKIDKFFIACVLMREFINWSFRCAHNNFKIASSRILSRFYATSYIECLGKIPTKIDILEFSSTSPLPKITVSLPLMAPFPRSHSVTGSVCVVVGCFGKEAKTTNLTGARFLIG